MHKKFIQKEQTKCNFCMNWFAIYSQVKFGLNVCETCIYKTLQTNCYKFPTPQGDLYQVYLAKRHISINNEDDNPLVEKVDEYMHSQLKALLAKWDKISNFINKKNNQNKQGNQNEAKWKKIQFILKNDRKKFESQTSQTIEQITEDLQNQPQVSHLPLTETHRTPLKEKKVSNISIKCVQSSAAKGLKRDTSKKSLGFKSSSKKSIILHDNQSKDFSPSPFTLQSSSRISSRSRITINIEGENAFESNRQFQAQMHNVKNNIIAQLEKKFGTKSANLLNIKKQKIFETIQNTTNFNKCIELVSYKIPHQDEFDMECYLNNLQWEGIQVVKFVKVGLTDDKIRGILECISDKGVETLVVTNNSLTEEAIQELTKWDIPSLKNIYIGKNNILPIKVRDQLGKLRKKYRIFV